MRISIRRESASYEYWVTLPTASVTRRVCPFTVNRYCVTLPLRSRVVTVLLAPS